jgi:hypothetical protein
MGRRNRYYHCRLPILGHDLEEQVTQHVNKLSASVENLNRAGRKPGSVNKATKELKDMILGALDAAGGQDYLQHQAETNPGPFLSLIGKVLPSTINATLGNADGSPLTVTVNFKRADED